MNQNIEQSFRERLDKLEQENAEIRAQVAAAQVRFLRAEGRFRFPCGLGLAAVAIGLLLSQTQSAASRQGGIPERVAALEAKTRFISTVGTEMSITGANLHILNGTGQTETTNGLGNLIVGYNELRETGKNPRTGSHNLIVGNRNDYLSFGGVVF